MKKLDKKSSKPQESTAAQKATTRRHFLRAGAGTGLFSAAATLGVSRSAHAQESIWDFLGLDGLLGNNNNYQAGSTVGIPTDLFRAASDSQRRGAFRQYYLTRAEQLDDQFRNNDEIDYANQRYYGSFTKCLPSNARAEVNPSAFEALVDALTPGSTENFDAIPLAANAVIKLANPQGALKYQSCGLDSHSTRMPPSHALSSPELAGEMVEVYWQALTRDVPYSEYPVHNLIDKACKDLKKLSAIPAQTTNGTPNPGNLFRGETPGDLAGPYISQFLWQDFAFGSIEVVQKYPTPKKNQDFMTTIEEWRSVQQGQQPSGAIEFRDGRRYIFNNRSLGEYVHRDVSFQAYLQAALILFGFGSSALSSSNPYQSSANQDAFVSHGAPFILDMLSRAAQAALHAAWYQKWVVHRTLRPEALGGRVHFSLAHSANYNIHSDLLNSKAVDRAFRKQGNYLLSQAYPEGSPTHPSYPAGHGCVAGACVTVLKALFNESYVFQDPVVASDNGRDLFDYSGGSLTVGGELNKLASNIALGRDAAGVHYRQDGVQGLYLGEQVAIELLREMASATSEANFFGYQFTRFDGTAEVISSQQPS